MNVYTVYGMYRNDRIDREFSFDCNIIAENELDAVNTFKEYYMKTQEFKKKTSSFYDLGDYQEDFSIYNLEIKGVSLLGLDFLSGKDDLLYAIPLPTLEYMDVSGIGDWNKALEVFTKDQDYFSKFRFLVIQDGDGLEDTEVYVFYYLGEWESSSTIEGIHQCERDGIDPFGYD